MGSGRDIYREDGRGGREEERLGAAEERGEFLGIAERGGALPTVLVKLYYLTFGFSQGH